MSDKLSLLEKIGGRVSILLLGDTKEMIVRNDERVQNLIKTSEGITHTVDEIKKTLNDVRISMATHGSDIRALQIHTKYGVNNSPTLPNEEGKKLLRESGFETQYPKLKEHLFGLMDAMNLRTLYDYEVGAVDAMKKLQNNPLMDLLKDYAVSHPEEPLELIYKVASWVIRDDYQSYKKIKN